MTSSDNQKMKGRSE